MFFGQSFAFNLNLFMLDPTAGNHDQLAVMDPQPAQIQKSKVVSRPLRNQFRAGLKEYFRMLSNCMLRRETACRQRE